MHTCMSMAVSLELERKIDKAACLALAGILLSCVLCGPCVYLCRHMLCPCPQGPTIYESPSLAGA